MMKWSLLAAGAGLALLVASWVMARDSTETFKTYRTGGVSFEYPASWDVVVPSAPSQGPSQVLVHASTDRLQDPCRHSPGQVTCGSPLTRLSRSGALITLYRRGLVTTQDFANLPGQPATIGGRRAKVQIRRPGTCETVGGDFTMLALIDSDRTDQYLVKSCLRDSDGSGERDARRLLSSIHFDPEA